MRARGERESRAELYSNLKDLRYSQVKMSSSQWPMLVLSVPPYEPVGKTQHFGGTYCLHL
jgi:hypothetical protein